MTPSVLFVDDEPSVLNALRRSLRLLRGTWEVHFAGDGPAAIELLKTVPVDVVVTDMRMPGMDGVQLLGSALQSHPAAVRIVMSGHSGTESIVESVALAHQYLAKPTDVDTLTAILAQVLKARERVPDEAARTTLGKVTALPVPPEILVELQRNPESLVVHAGQDPLVAARVLQVANNAFFGLKRGVTDPVEAAQTLRAEHAQALLGASNGFTQRGGDAAHALRVRARKASEMAQQLAQKLGGDESTVKTAGAAALLGAMGPILSVAPDSGAVTSEQSAYLLAIWGLPEALVDAVAFATRPSASPSASLLLTAVNAAQVLSGSCAPDEAYAPWLASGPEMSKWPLAGPSD